jgi:hypothetical protein
MSREWPESELAGPDPDEEEHVEGDNTEIVERESVGDEDKGRTR